MTSPVSISTPHETAPRRETPISQALSGVFGAPFHVRESTDSGLADVSIARAVVTRFCVEQTAWSDPGHLAAAVEIDLGGGVTVFHLPFGPAVLVVPDSQPGGPRNFAVGELPTADSDLVASNIEFALRTANERLSTDESESLLESYAAQLSQAYEEINWLRGLSEQLGQCEVSRSLTDVAADTLPALRRLLQTQAAVFVEVGEDQGSDYVERLRVAHWSGDQIISDTSCCELIAAMSMDNLCDTVVRNRMTGYGSFDGGQPLESMLLTPVVKGRQAFGWLILLNRNGHASHVITNHDILGLDEFGTEEAGMAESAAVMLATHARNVQLFKERETMMLGTIQSLVRTLEARDEYTCGHSDRVAHMSQMLAIELGLPDYECRRIYRTGLLHDIGKVGVPDEVLSKPGSLTNAEFEIIKRHTVVGYEILKDLKSFEYMLPGVRWHHERIDGRGYPDGLKGEELPFMPRIMAVADAMDAMTSNRPYRNGMPFEKAESILREGAGTQWDVEVVAAYFQIRDQMQEFCRGHSKSSILSGLTAISTDNAV